MFLKVLFGVHIECLPSVERWKFLAFSFFFSQFDKVFPFVGKECPKLNLLNFISMKNISDEFLNGIFRLMSHIPRLFIMFLRFSNELNRVTNWNRYKIGAVLKYTVKVSVASVKRKKNSLKWHVIAFFAPEIS